MPREEKVVSILLSSPSDLAEERAVVDDIVKELNTTWSRTLRIRLELLRWEDYTHPDIGADAQTVINAQLPTDYDVFVGIMWTRFGTPTLRAGSGTQEEFDQALARYRTNPDALSILFYFKDQPQSPSTIDPVQLGSVHAFRRRLASEGLLLGDFKTAGDFEGLLRIHLSQLAQKWAQHHPGGPPHPSAGSPVSVDVGSQAANIEEQEVGLFDSMDAANDRFTEATEHLKRLSGFLQTMAAGLSRVSEDMARSSPTSPRRLQVAKRHTARAAAVLEQYSSDTLAELPRFSQLLAEAIGFTGQAMSYVVDFGPDAAPSLETSLDGIAQLRSIMSVSLDSLRGLRDSASRLPRMSAALIAAKRRAAAAMDSFSSEIETAVSLLDDVVARTRETLNALTGQNGG